MILTYENRYKILGGAALAILLLMGGFCLFSGNPLDDIKDKRISMIQECANKLEDNGMMYFTVFSEKEVSYGKGKEVEKNTYESRPGRPAHYFTEDDLKEHFRYFQLVETGIVEEDENHGEGPHTHILRYICVRHP